MHTAFHYHPYFVLIRARETVGFAGSGPIFESKNRFCPQQEDKKSVHKSSFFSVQFLITVYNSYLSSRAREIVGFAGSGPIFETENRFISRQEA